MKIILDTHTFLWFITDDPSLSSSARIQLEHGPLGANPIMGKIKSEGITL